MSGQRRASYIRWPDMAYLLDFGELVNDAFDAMPYLVGSALETRDYGDVDVRVILPDRRFRLLFGSLDPSIAYMQHSRWGVVCRAFSALGRQMTRLPIDFQVQSMTRANTEPGAKARIPIGLGRIESAPPPPPTPETACDKCGHETARHGEMGCTVPTGNHVYETTCPCCVRPGQPREVPA